jgi:hypothetical protein
MKISVQRREGLDDEQNSVHMLAKFRSHDMLGLATDTIFTAKISHVQYGRLPLERGMAWWQDFATIPVPRKL